MVKQVVIAYLPAVDRLQRWNINKFMHIECIESRILSNALDNVHQVYCKEKSGTDTYKQSGQPAQTSIELICKLRVLVVVLLRCFLQ